MTSSKVCRCGGGGAEDREGHAAPARVVEFAHGNPPSEGWGNVGAVREGTSAAMAMLGEIGPDDIATILYTSGSTGKSKGAWSDHRGVVHGVMNYIAQSAMAKVLSRIHT